MVVRRNVEPPPIRFGERSIATTCDDCRMRQARSLPTRFGRSWLMGARSARTASPVSIRATRPSTEASDL